jgi:uncharacterized Tic20 family protein
MRQRAARDADRTLAILAHASIGFGFVGIGFLLGLLINAVIWLRSRRSSYLAVQSEQAGAYQLAVLLVNVGLIAAWAFVLVYAIFGDSELGAAQLSGRQIAAGLWLALIPLFLVWYVGSILYGLYGATRIARGHDFWYPFFGAWARRRAGPPR